MEKLIKSREDRLTALVKLKYGNMEERNKYWKEEEEGLCVFCRKDFDCLRHCLEYCQVVKE